MEPNKSNATNVKSLWTTGMGGCSWWKMVKNGENGEKWWTFLFLWRIGREIGIFDHFHCTTNLVILVNPRLAELNPTHCTKVFELEMLNSVNKETG